MSQDFNEKNKNSSEGFGTDDKYAYKNVITGKQNSRTWSVVSLILSLLSIAFCFIPWLGIVLGLAAICLSVLSRKIIGYFDGFALAGLIIGIFGVVFSISAIILKNVLVNIFVNLFA